MSEALALERPVHGPGCGCTRCVGFQPGHTLTLAHGASSERHIRPLARNQKRRVLRQMGLRSGDVDPIGRALLEHYVRSTAKIALIDAWVDEHGLLLDDGTPQPCMRLYVSLTNTATRTLAKLEQHLRAVGDREPAVVLAAMRERELAR